LYLLIIDIDKFKEINDSCGHNFGDEVLRQISKIIIEETRSTDIQVRLGGEEFAIFLALKDEEKIFIISNRIQERISNVNLAEQMVDKKNPPKISVSGGIIKRRFNETIAGAIFRADMLLYQAKNTGRRKILHDLS
jgi:diguanylate cyclase (GGDEF)-like protein